MGHGWKKPPKNDGNDAKNISDVQESFTTCLQAPTTYGKTKVFNIFILKNLVFYSQEQKQAFPAGRWHNQRTWPRRSVHSNSDRQTWTDHPVWRTCLWRHLSQLRQRRGNGLTILSIYILFLATSLQVHFFRTLPSHYLQIVLGWPKHFATGKQTCLSRVKRDALF